MLKKYWKQILGLIILGSLLAYFIPKVDWNEILAAIKGANPKDLGLSLCFVVLYWAVRSCLLWELIRPKVTLKYWFSFYVTVIGMTVDQLVPGRVGLLARWLLLHSRLQISKSFVAFAILSNLLIEAFGLVSFVAVVFFLDRKNLFDLTGLGWEFPMGLLVVCFLILLFLLNFPKFESFMKRLPRLTSSALFCSLSELVNFGRSPWRLCRWLSYGLLNWLVQSLIMYFAGAAFGIQLSFSEIVLILAGVNLAILVPVVPGNIGSIQLAIVFLMTRFGYDSTSSLAFAITYHACHLVPLVSVGTFSWLASGLGLKRLIGSNDS